MDTVPKPLAPSSPFLCFGTYREWLRCICIFVMISFSNFASTLRLHVTDSVEKGFEFIVRRSWSRDGVTTGILQVLLLLGIICALAEPGSGFDGVGLLFVAAAILTVTAGIKLYFWSLPLRAERKRNPRLLKVFLIYASFMAGIVFIANIFKIVGNIGPDSDGETLIASSLWTVLEVGFLAFVAHLAKCRHAELLSETKSVSCRVPMLVPEMQVSTLDEKPGIV